MHPFMVYTSRRRARCAIERRLSALRTEFVPWRGSRGPTGGRCASTGFHLSGWGATTAARFWRNVARTIVRPDGAGDGAGRARRPAYHLVRKQAAGAVPPPPRPRPPTSLGSCGGTTPWIRANREPSSVPAPQRLWRWTSKPPLRPGALPSPHHPEATTRATPSAWAMGQPDRHRAPHLVAAFQRRAARRLLATMAVPWIATTGRIPTRSPSGCAAIAVSHSRPYHSNQTLGNERWFHRSDDLRGAAAGPDLGCRCAGSWRRVTTHVMPPREAWPWRLRR